MRETGMQQDADCGAGGGACYFSPQFDMASPSNCT